ncbi:MAG TPA: hypothetical protein VM223_24835 [Planctomycetota bacterium]|nr:hypothetical protein [Planctomycetota bacterium]
MMNKEPHRMANGGTIDAGMIFADIAFLILHSSFIIHHSSFRGVPRR